ncbi:hypothetical protein F4859DRAFT_451626 [Xylaria cf. heliscus]|nr:hypothetical protein F4859DRAFT_451626 [Xylaria cf. heliscus]
MEALAAGIHNLSVALKQSCCNDSNGTPCEKPGTFACKDCLMVTYCSKACQKSHWTTHRKDCKSSFMSQTWEPRWITQNRGPAFSNGSPQIQTHFGTPRYLWGNVPAIDIIQLGKNEGVDFQGPMRILFAASGDMRNVIRSVASLPSSYQGPLNITLNDREIDIVARNIIFLLLFFVEDNPTIASEYVLHMWYSALITEACNQILQEKVKPLVEAVCSKIAQKPSMALLGKTWQFGSNSLRLVLTRDNWFSLLRYFDIPQGLTKDSAQQVRQRVMAAPERIDFVDRALCTMSPSARLGMAKFREDGILFPFGKSREAFTNPNPTMFLSLDEWPMMDSADPTAGWPMKSFLEFDAGPATGDVYGRLYFYLKDLFADFHRRIRSSPVTFELLHIDARALPTSLTEERFDRIDVGNICDMAYLGTETTLKTFRPLLQPPSVNPHATLITLFLNAVAEVIFMVETTPPGIFAPFINDRSQCLRRVLQYMPELGRQHVHPYHPNMVKLICAMGLVYDMDKYFDCYMETHDFKSLALDTGLQMKSTPTIIDAWPWRMSGGRPTPTARKDFAVLLASAHTGQERFVEWKVTAGVIVEDVA